MSCRFSLITGFSLLRDICRQVFSLNAGLSLKAGLGSHDKLTFPDSLLLGKVTLGMLRNQACSWDSLQVGAIDGGLEFTFLLRVLY
jgi:hypothetical protein